MNKKILLLLYLIIVFNFINYVHANDYFIKSTFFTYENDSVFGPDRYYSNGIQLFFISKDFKSSENQYISNIFEIKNKHSHNFTFGIGQKIFTPRDIKITEFLENDRPYAGYLYFFLNKTIFHDENKYDTLGINIGATGKMSGAEWVQKKIHNLIGSPQPMGWKYQLPNEILIMASWTHMEMLNFPISNTYDWNIIPKLSVNLGTPNTDVKLAMELRYGWNLQNDLLPNKLQNLVAGVFEVSDNLSYYGFFEVETDFIIYNTFLDGNLFKKYKNDVEKNFFHYELLTGGALNYKNFYTKISVIYMSKEFKKQRVSDNQVLFSITGGWFF